MYITIQKPFDHLENELQQTFACNKDTHIIIERRIEDRRKHCLQVTCERRVMKRRRPKKEMIEILMTV